VGVAVGRIGGEDFSDEGRRSSMEVGEVAVEQVDDLPPFPPTYKRSMFGVKLTEEQLQQR
jgi:hypothetical protein